MKRMITAAGVVAASLSFTLSPAATAAAHSGRHVRIYHLFETQPQTCQLTAGGWSVCCHFLKWTPQNLGLVEDCKVTNIPVGVYVQPS